MWGFSIVFYCGYCGKEKLEVRSRKLVFGNPKLEILGRKGYSVIACWCKKSNLHEVVIVVHLYLHYNLSRIYKKWIYG